MRPEFIALDDEEESADEGGRVEESRSWGIREIAGEDKELDKIDSLRLDDVGDGGGDGFGRVVNIFGAGRMSLPTEVFFPLL